MTGGRRTRVGEESIREMEEKGEQEDSLKIYRHRERGWREGKKR